MNLIKSDLALVIVIVMVAHVLIVLKKHIILNSAIKTLKGLEKKNVRWQMLNNFPLSSLSAWNTAGTPV